MFASVNILHAIVGYTGGLLQQWCGGRARSQSYGTAQETDVSPSTWTRQSHLTPHPLPYLYNRPRKIPHIILPLRWQLQCLQKRRKIITLLSGIIIKDGLNH